MNANATPIKIDFRPAGPRSAWPQIIKGDYLTDKQIERYELLGKYGPEQQKRAKEREAAKLAMRTVKRLKAARYINLKELYR